jgi:hypothetical protein
MTYPIADRANPSTDGDADLLDALRKARAALENATQNCRYHGDVPPAPPNSWRGAGCDTCEQPARVRAALAALRRLAGDPQPPRAYTVDTARRHQANGLHPVNGINGLWVDADPRRARAAIIGELHYRGEDVHPDTITVQIGDPRT